MSAQSASLAAIRDRHRDWLARHDLLGRPWLVLGSAPSPTIPSDVGSRVALVCINNSVATAAQMGLRAPSLTFRNRNKEWRSVAGCDIPLVLWLSDKNRLQVFWSVMTRARLHARVGEVRTIPKHERDTVSTHVLGSNLADVGAMNKASTGVFAAIYGFFVGVPEIILSGISMDKDGYSYNADPGVQRHRVEDIFALQVLQSRFTGLRTSEADLAKQVGLPFYG